MPLDEHDLQQLQRALELAESAIGRSDPNPRVGCVLHDAQGRLAGVGATQAAGSDHAEVVALRQAQERQIPVGGGTAWVSLEPCSHHGRTPPCCEALERAGVARVVVASVDPNPLVAGGGIARLRAAGIRVDVADGAVARQARELNIGFFSRMVRRTPWVRLKIAASLDGKTAMSDGESQWITDEAARADGHGWRRRAGAVLTGAGTVQQDNPRLDVRSVPTERQPLRVVVDSRLQCPPASRIFDAPGSVLVYCTRAQGPAADALRRRGVELAEQPGPHDKVDLPAMLADLAARGINELHVESGERLNASFLRESLVDELLLYLAPRLIGTGRDMFAGAAFTGLAQTPELRIFEATMIGRDLRLVARVAGRDAFLA
ncbi:MAG: bifunctional diaminohydroxyphosphoribosylaminopyrimidine deaminase/5-amino-6-(5-phosphoribosylamino)uracil reductase RibD [Burkholderiaceae bacterium]|jgi:diaminohydroxyphosphoribosylaminopyrimidine deaminase/5-amino-6-(5-phosphoribosylamino)uracil reductase|nr:bifunctional diaminohydroxyphosphoribosylaminopyrimidine deaminase/5-amino-6-(5-phosphoribosylamino)uracil reductase RibD [Burkholderiaceae bacterium]